MMTKHINGLQFEHMIRNGLGALMQMEERVNNLNVFPVADGDTGTNMCLTLENGIKHAASGADLGAYLEGFSTGLLLGARGNSGVILSQFFRGVWQELADCSAAGPTQWRKALVRGYKIAYASVAKPVEGTMLTVFREGIEQSKDRMERCATMEDGLGVYIAELKHSLALTTQRLPALKEAGVVDSGAMGFVIVIEGMLKWLGGEVIAPRRRDVDQIQPIAVSTEFFNEDSTFEEGYCMEFLLQLLKNGDYSPCFRVSRFVEDLKRFGESIAVVQDKSRVKVHIHTRRPAKIIQLAQEFGEFVTFKLENMQLQHNEHISRQAAAEQTQKPLAIVCATGGAGNQTLFRELGCDYVIDGGNTMNTSSNEFLDAFSQVHADTVVVLPNHKNNIPAAEQAIKLWGRGNVHLLPSKSLAEGYFAVAMDVPDSEDVDYRIAQMGNGLRQVVTLAQTTASRDYTFHQISCKTGDELVLKDDQLVCVCDDWCTAIIQALQQLADIDERECCVIFRGKDADQAQQERLEQQLAEQFPYLEPTFLDGGQEIYRWIIGIT